MIDVILDTDIGGCDFDDEFAMEYLASKSDFNIVGVITSDCDNSNPELAINILKKHDKYDDQVYEGADRFYDYFDKDYDYYEIYNKHYKTAKIVCIGPVTNLAFYASQNPDFFKKAEIYQMGASNMFAFPDFNFKRDILAAKFIYSKNVNARIVPKEITNHPDNVVIKGGILYNELIKHSVKKNIVNFFKKYPKGYFYLNDLIPTVSVNNPNITTYGEPSSIEFFENYTQKYIPNKESKIRVCNWANYNLTREIALGLIPNF